MYINIKTYAVGRLDTAMAVIGKYLGSTGLIIEVWKESLEVLIHGLCKWVLVFWDRIEENGLLFAQSGRVECGGLEKDWAAIFKKSVPLFWGRKCKGLDRRRRTVTPNDVVWTWTNICIYTHIWDYGLGFGDIHESNFWPELTKLDYTNTL